jgi:hypothetical protein
LEQSIMRERQRFIDFYRTQYRAEHRVPANVALHLAGVALGLGVIVAGIAQGPLWMIVLFPIAHALPGLVGHRLFERDAEVGDLRMLRNDVPPWWFIIANHMLAVDVLLPFRPFGLPR